MDQVWADVRFCSRFVRDTEEGYAGVELHEIRGAKDDVVARVLFWDADGHFYVETFGTDVPLDVLETLISEARAGVRVR